MALRKEFPFLTIATFGAAANDVFSVNWKSSAVSCAHTNAVLYSSMNRRHVSCRIAQHCIESALNSLLCRLWDDSQLRQSTSFEICLHIFVDSKLYTSATVTHGHPRSVNCCCCCWRWRWWRWRWWIAQLTVPTQGSHSNQTIKIHTTFSGAWHRKIMTYSIGQLRLCIQVILNWKIRCTVHSELVNYQVIQSIVTLKK